MIAMDEVLETAAPTAFSLSQAQVLLLQAHHEAGHAVVAMNEGLPVISLEIRQHDGTDGSWSIDGITYMTYLPRLADGFALQGAAGELAALRWLDENGLRSEEIVAAANADHDRDQVIELLTQDGIRISWPDVRNRAQNLVRALWPQIRTVAHAAAEKGRLTEAEITNLVTATA
ncbi:hypothetical protein AB0D78_28275 [Streptomyces avermitilis]|uniref:hypothetical protein n=1 Tax=Streptomyces avermitilis TaxID=33903 RepID=UPI003405B388